MNYLGPNGTRLDAGTDPELVQFLQPRDAAQLIHRIQRGARNGGQLVELIGASGGEGTSSLARDFALLMVRRSERPVLLLDLDVPVNGHYRWLAERTTMAPEPTRIGIPGGELRLHRMGNSPLMISELALDSPLDEPRADLLAESQVLDQLRGVFSLIVADLPPLAASFEGVAFSALADATIMVVEAERTRAPVALNLANRLTETGAQLVGFVFNKRRYYVPDFLYREL